MPLDPQCEALLNQMAEKKVAPKAPAAKSSSTSGKAAATRVTKKKVLKRMKKIG